MRTKKIVVILLVALAVLLTAPAEQGQAGPPVLPALCYGELTVNGSPAPVGTKVIARVDGEVRGELVSTEEGWYGGPGLKAKLTVSGNELVGKMVRFYVSGTYQGIDYSDVFAWEQLYWGSGEVMQINLGVRGVESAPEADPPAVAVPDPLPDPVEGSEPQIGAPETPQEPGGVAPDDTDGQSEADPAGTDDGDPDSDLLETADPGDGEAVAGLPLGWALAVGAITAAALATMIYSNVIRKRKSVNEKVDDGAAD